MAEHLTGTFRYRTFLDMVKLFGLPLWAMDTWSWPAKHLLGQFDVLDVVVGHVISIYLIYYWIVIIRRFALGWVELTEDELVTNYPDGRVRRMRRESVARIIGLRNKSGLRVMSELCDIEISGEIADWRLLRPALLEFAGSDPSSNLGMVPSQSFPTFERWAEELRTRLQRSG